MKVRSGDTVAIIAGKDKGKQGKILQVSKANNRVIVEGVNIATKHVKPRSANEPGQIVKIERSIDASNVMIICPVTKKPTRIGLVREEGKLVRISKKSGKAL